MSTQHTKGPWIAVDRDTGDGVCQVIPASAGLRICTVTNSAHDADNARLIAAAPELLEACRSLLALCEGGTGDALQRMDAARAAIEKATQ